MTEAEHAFASKCDISVIITVAFVQRRQVEDFRACVASDNPFRRGHGTVVTTYFHALRSVLSADSPHFVAVRFCADGHITDEAGRRVRFIHVAATPVRRPGLPVLDAEPCGAAFIIPVVVHVVQPGRPGHGHIDAVAVLHIR